MALLAPVPLRGNHRVEADGRGRVSDPALTPRQRQVLGLLIRGLTNKEIGAALGIGPDAVKRVISRLLAKLDAPSRTALARQALETSAARRDRARGPNALSLLDAVPVPAFVTRGPEHHLEYANAAAHRVLPEISPGRRLAELLRPAPRRSVERSADETLATGEPRVARRVALHDFVSFGRTWRLVDVFTSPMYDGANKLAGLVVFFLDVSNDPAPAEGSAASSISHDRARPA
jgi:DNA-binding CsgD family transcriptional regulator